MRTAHHTGSTTSTIRLILAAVLLAASMVAITTASGATPTASATVSSESIGAAPNRTVPTIAAGGLYTCALSSTGDITCWGSDVSGQLGTPGIDADLSEPGPPVTLPGNTTATAIATGNSHTCALLNTGDITCWGSDGFGQLGNGSPNTNLDAPSTPITLPDDTTATAITAGNSHTCALLNTGDITCWGNNFSGQLGNGSPDTTLSEPGPPITLPGNTTATAITAGGAHTCALLNTGDITCWGSDSSAQVGNGATTGNVTTPTSIVDLTTPFGTGTTATAITAGNSHTCALLNTGDITCWGSDSSAQVGNGATTGDVPEPADLVDLTPFGTGTTATAIAAGFAHTCAMLNTGDITCWGSDGFGQLGNGSPNTNLDAPSTPITLPDDTTATAITAGSFHTCALLNTGDITCWGSDGFGRLGTPGIDADLSEPGPPVTLPGDTTATAITAGGAHTCALLNTGDITCWGNDELGQVGNGATTGDVTTPTSIVDLTPFGTGTTATAITAGASHTCALLNTGDITCWGNDFDGQVGNGPASSDDVTTPTSIVDLTPFGTGTTATAITAGALHTCALLNTGDITCWGRDFDGQVGNGPASSDDVTTPTSIVDLTPFGTGTTAAAITAGGAHTCALLNTGDITCWGRDELGQVGNGPASSDDVTTPTSIVDLTPFGTGTTATAITAGAFHTCALLNTGDITCWGSDFDEQVGNGPASSDDVTTPTSIVDLTPFGTGTTATAITAGASHTCALLNTGDITCWGNDFDGQVGNGPASSDDVTTPTSIVDLTPFGTGTTATAITAAGVHACALLNTGDITCWGRDFDGQVGNGATTGIVDAPVSLVGAPAAPSAVSATAGDTTASLAWTPPPTPPPFGDIAGWQIERSDDDGTTWTIAVADTGSATPSADVTGLTNNIPYVFRVSGINAVGVGDPTVSNEVTPAPPPMATIAAAGGQADPTNTDPVVFTATFDQPVAPPSAVTVGGTAGASTAVVSPDTGLNDVYTISVTGITSSGDVTVSIPADTTTNTNGQGNLASNTATVTVDVDGPVPTIDFGDGQAAIVDSLPIVFTMVFDEPPVGFNSFDVTVSGTAGATAATVTGSGTTYLVTIDTITNPGTVTIDLDDAVFTDALGNPNQPAVVLGDTVIVTADVTRIGGATRIDTAIDVSRTAYADDTAGAVVLARADLYPDALVGGPLAAVVDAPLLITPNDSLPAEVLTEIDRVLPPAGTVYVLGGTAAIDTAVTDTITAAGYTVIRYAGTNRYETATDVADAIDTLGGDTTTALLAVGTNFPDALTASAAGAQHQHPVLLTGDATPNPTTDTWLTTNTPTQTVCVGGPACRAYPDSITQLIGGDRYGTAIRVAETFFPTSTNIGVASGERFPDALVAAADTPHRNGPLVLTKRDFLPPPTGNYIIDTNPTTVTIYGGPAAIGPRIARQVTGPQP